LFLALDDFGADLKKNPDAANNYARGSCAPVAWRRQAEAVTPIPVFSRTGRALRIQPGRLRIAAFAEGEVRRRRSTMSAPQIETMSTPNPAGHSVPARPQLRVWPAVLIVVAYWVAVTVCSKLDLPIYKGFFSSVIASFLTGLLFAIWFLTRRAIPGRDRLIVFGVAVAGTVLVRYVADSSVGFIGVLFAGLPLLCTAWAIWLLIARKWSPAVIRNGLLILLFLIWGQFTLVRIDGIDGEQKADVSLRWSRTAEDLYLAEHASNSTSTSTSTSAKSAATPKLESSGPHTLALAPGDWAGFRGADRQGELRGSKIATDWKTAPPKLLWKQRIGPAWSSFVVLGQRLYTQEQRHEDEAVVCLEAATGKELWVHLDPKARFSDGQAGAGPRSSPVFDKGCLYSMGATGIVNCLDAGTGEKIWSQNVVTDSGAPLPMWGFSSSPLVAGGNVIVYAGGPGEKGLLAYRADDGKSAWSVATGPVSYSSPHLVKLGGEPQVLFLSDLGLIALDPKSGKLLWQYEAPSKQIWRVAQPRQIGDSAIVLGSEDLGLVKLDLAHHDGAWTPTVAWKSQALRPAYNDFVYQDGFIYGFDEGFGCCVDAQTGQRKWKGGRYGHGQLLLLADQKLLLVISEYGQVALVSARPEKYEELGHFEAISGKTWNHPVVAHGRLYVRNSEEAACYELATPEVRAARALRTESTATAAVR
jgi:outer membrane protein assembly factor BamB